MKITQQIGAKILAEYFNLKDIEQVEVLEMHRKTKLRYTRIIPTQTIKDPQEIYASRSQTFELEVDWRLVEILKDKKLCS